MENHHQLPIPFNPNIVYVNGSARLVDPSYHIVYYSIWPWEHEEDKTGQGEREWHGLADLSNLGSKIVACFTHKNYLNLILKKNCESCIGFLPITLTNLNSYANPVVGNYLFMKENQQLITSLNSTSCLHHTISWQILTAPVTTRKAKSIYIGQNEAKFHMIILNKIDTPFFLRQYILPSIILTKIRLLQ